MAVETRERMAYRNPPPIEKLVPPQEKSLAQDAVSMVPKVEPTEIFPQVKKTPRMIEVQQVTQEDIQKFLNRNYSVKGSSQRDICRSITAISDGNIQLQSGTISDWMRKFNIAARSSSEGAKLAWQNPEKRERRIKSIHSPMADRKRGKSLSKNWRSLSESEKRDRARAVSEGRRKELLRNMRETRLPVD